MRLLQACRAGWRVRSALRWLACLVLFLSLLSGGCLGAPLPSVLNATVLRFSLSEAVSVASLDDEAFRAALWQGLAADLARAELLGVARARVFAAEPLRASQVADPYPDIVTLAHEGEAGARLPHAALSLARSARGRAPEAGAVGDGPGSDEPRRGRRRFRTQDLELVRVTLALLPPEVPAALDRATDAVPSSDHAARLWSLLQAWHAAGDAGLPASPLQLGNVTRFIHPKVAPQRWLANFTLCGDPAVSDAGDGPVPYALACPVALHRLYWGTTGLTVAIVLGLLVFTLVFLVVWWFWTRQENRRRLWAVKIVRPELRAVIFGAHNTKFKQHTLDAWQPVWSHKTVALVMAALALLLLPLGAHFLAGAARLVEVRARYDHLPGCAAEQADEADPNQACVVDLRIPRDMAAPVYLYYELTEFYANHRSYVQSRSDAQLRNANNRGADSAPSIATECAALLRWGDWPAGAVYPWSASSSGGGAGVVNNASSLVAPPADALLYPCGLVAHSYFSDRFPLAWVTSDAILAAEAHGLAGSVNAGAAPGLVDPAERAAAAAAAAAAASNATAANATFAGPSRFVLRGRNWLARGIAWESDFARFRARSLEPGETSLTPRGLAGPRSPDDSMRLPRVDDESFLVWMRSSAFSRQSKLARRILDRSLRAGERVRVQVQSRWPTRHFGGEKRLVLATTNSLGTKNEFIGAAYVSVGLLYGLTGLLLYLLHRGSPAPLSAEETLQLALDAQRMAEEEDRAWEGSSAAAPQFNAAQLAGNVKPKLLPRSSLLDLNRKT